MNEQHTQNPPDSPVGDDGDMIVARQLVRGTRPTAGIDRERLGRLLDRLESAERALGNVFSAFDKSGNVPMFLAATIRHERTELSQPHSAEGGRDE